MDEDSKRGSRSALLRYLGALRWLPVAGRRRAHLSMHEAQRLRAWDDTQEFIYSMSSRATRLFADQWELREYAFNRRTAGGVVLEFGVYRGASINFFAELLRRQADERTITGFDSFAGFSEDWTGVEKQYEKDHFRIEGPPQVKENVTLVQGPVEETLPTFVEKLSDTVSFVHIDTDTYSPAKVVLSQLKGKFTAGTVILFDELAGYPNWRQHEYAALSEVLSQDEYEFIGFGTSSVYGRLVKAAIQIR